MSKRAVRRAGWSRYNNQPPELIATYTLDGRGVKVQHFHDGGGIVTWRGGIESFNRIADALERGEEVADLMDTEDAGRARAVAAQAAARP